MTVGDLKRLLENEDENKIVIFRDSSNYDCHYLKNKIYTSSNYVLIPEDLEVDNE